MKDWLRTWGPWIGPSAIVAFLAIGGRVESHFTIKTMGEMRLKAIEAYIEEHKQVTISRISQLEALDRMQAIDHTMIERFDKERAEDRKRLERIEDRLARIENRLILNGRGAAGSH